MKQHRPRWASWAIYVSISLMLCAEASAAPPTVQDFLTAMKLSPNEIERVKAGEIVNGTGPSSHDRELVATMTFLIPGIQPDDLVERGQGGLLDRVDEQTISFEMLPNEPSLESFAALKLRPEDLRQFSDAEAGDRLNLSPAEIETFQDLGPDATETQIERAVHAALLARVGAYKQAGLAGIPYYQRSEHETRSPAEDLKKATLASESVREIAPEAHGFLLAYPDSKPEGAEETYRWTYLDAHDEPTIVLTHTLYVPEGGTWLVTQRQFYVSEGYNCEQAIAAFVPVEKGTAVFYVNRTSTDQVSGFGGSAKRSIGSKLLASQLKELFEEFREAASPD